MPIQIEFHHPDRMVVMVAHGTITLQDLAQAFVEFAKSGAFHYRKILDVTRATPGFTKDEMLGFIEHLRRHPREKQGGLVAFVTAPNNGEFARLFVEIAGNDRPAQVFRSIHEARKWLYANSSVTP